MTLAQIATFICNKLTLLDLNSIALCKAFLNARYSMIQDAYQWQDIQMTVQIGLDSGENVKALPDGMNRVVAIRSNDQDFLDPVNVNLLMQTDPTIFERTGNPTVYLENYDSGQNERQITVYPITEYPVSLMISGVRTLPALGDTDESVIRNIDNVLIAFGTYDMLQRGRQYEKAKVVLEEANALLQAAQEGEKTQGNQPRLAKQLTVAGNSLSELTDAVCARTGQWSLDSVVLIKEFLRRQYQRIWDACNWSESTVLVRVNTDGAEVIMPVFVDRIIAARMGTDAWQLSVGEASHIYGINPGIFEQTGTAVGFDYLTPVGVAALPPTREKLSFSSAWGDDRQRIRVIGEIRGSEASETVVLQGTVPQLTINEYDTPLMIAKELTHGDVTVTGATSGVQLIRILATERERKHMRIFLHPTPTATTVLILGKRRITPFAQAEDTPLLRDIQDVLINAAAGDMFAKSGDKDSAASARDAANTALETLVDLETNQGAYCAQVVPETDGYYGDGYYSNPSWLVSKAS